MGDAPEKNRGGKAGKKTAPARTREAAAPTEAAPSGIGVASASHSSSAAAAPSATITTADLNRNIGAVIEHVSTGGTVTLTRYGAPVAYITPVVTGNFADDAATVTQALPTIATSPQLRPTHQVDPQIAQRRRDELLGKINRSKRK